MNRAAYILKQLAHGVLMVFALAGWVVGWYAVLLLVEGALR